MDLPREGLIMLASAPTPERSSRAIVTELLNERPNFLHELLEAYEHDAGETETSRNLTFWFGSPRVPPSAGRCVTFTKKKTCPPCFQDCRFGHFYSLILAAAHRPPSSWRYGDSSDDRNPLKRIPQRRNRIA